MTEEKVNIQRYELEIILGLSKALWEIAQTYNKILKKIEGVTLNFPTDIFCDMSWEEKPPTRENLLVIFEVSNHE